MLISLNGLVDLASAMAGRPFDVPLQEQLKVIFNYKRADWMQKVLDKHPEQRRYFLKDIDIDLVDVDEVESLVSAGYTIKRTSLPIPLPLRTEETFFDFVGSPDKTNAFPYTKPDQLPSILNYGSLYTKSKAKYYYANNYVYILNDNMATDIGISGLWLDQRQLMPFKKASNPAYTDDMQYDIADDIINTMIQDVIKSELRLYLEDQKDDEVATTTPKEKLGK